MGFLVYAYRLLSFYYNVKVGLYLLYNLVNEGPSALQVKDRPEKPKVLADGEYTHRFVEINGLKLHYVEKGDRSKPLMLFVHGFPEFWYSWRHQIQEFSKDFWCVAIDQRGYNESAKPDGLAPYALDNLVSDIRELVRHLDKKCILVCHDWGSIIGFEYVRRHMDTVEKYIMMSAPPLQVHRQMNQVNKEQEEMSWYVHFFQGLYVPELVLRSSDLRIFEEMKSESTTPEDIEAFKYVFGQEGALTPPLNYYRANTAAPLPEIPPPEEYAPGLLLLCDRDKYISKDCGPAAEKSMKNLKFKLLEDTDHFCQQNNPKLVNKVMKSFLDEHEKKANL